MPDHTPVDANGTVGSKRQGGCHTGEAVSRQTRCAVSTGVWYSRWSSDTGASGGLVGHQGPRCRADRGVRLCPVPGRTAPPSHRLILPDELEKELLPALYYTPHLSGRDSRNATFVPSSVRSRAYDLRRSETNPWLHVGTNVDTTRSDLYPCANHKWTVIRASSLSVCLQRASGQWKGSRQGAGEWTGESQAERKPSQ